MVVNAGIVRRMDSLGRVVIPKEMRKVLNMNVGDLISISVVNNHVVIARYQCGCVFCGSKEDVIEYKDVCVCKKCRKALNK